MRGYLRRATTPRSPAPDPRPVHPTRSRSRRALLALPALLALACGGDDGSPPPVDPVVRTAVLESPNGDEGAAVIALEGEVAAVTALDGATVFAEPVGGATRVIVVRQTPGALRFQVRLAGATPPAATIVEVADGADRLRASLAGYQVRWEP